MKRSTKNVTVFVMACFWAGAVSAQTNYPKYEFGVNAGFTVYQGDLTPEPLGSFKTQKPALGMYALRFLSPFFSIRGVIVRGRLKGDDALYLNPAYRRERNFNFSTPVTELSAQFVLNPLGSNYKDKGISAYFFAGAGLSFLRISRDWSQFNAAYFGSESSDILTGLAADTARSLPRIIPVIPAGAGLKYFLTQQLGVNAEAAYRLAYTDYMDGFSQSANPKLNDHYFSYSIGIVYRTGKKDSFKCPVIRY